MNETTNEQTVVELTAEESITEEQTIEGEGESIYGDGPDYAEEPELPKYEEEAFSTTDPCRPSDGSLGEFAGDVKSFFVRVGDDIEGRLDNIRDSWNGVFHRTRPQPLNQPK